MNENPDMITKPNQAEIIRQACISAAREGFLNASISGLCSDGAIEAAISAIQNLDLSNVINNTKS